MYIEFLARGKKTETTDKNLKLTIYKSSNQHVYNKQEIT